MTVPRFALGDVSVFLFGFRHARLFVEVVAESVGQRPRPTAHDIRRQFLSAHDRVLLSAVRERHTEHVDLAGLERRFQFDLSARSFALPSENRPALMAPGRVRPQRFDVQGFLAMDENVA